MNCFKKLLGNNIYLSPRGCSDEEIELHLKWANDFQITDYIGSSCFVYTYEKEKKILEGSINNDEMRIFNIVDLKNNKMIGDIGLYRIDMIDRSATLCMYIGEEDYRNKGYGTEALQLLLDFGFKYLNLHSVGLEVLSTNERAHNCYLKCGFKDTGLHRDNIFLNGKYYDMLTMDILENEFSGDYIKNKNVK